MNNDKSGDEGHQPGHQALIELEQRKTNRVYAAMVAMLIFSCMPNAVLQVAGILAMFYAMINAYRFRAGSDPSGMLHNHMTFLIRTFWISSLFFLVGFAADIAWLTQSIDLDMLNGLSNSFLATGTVPFDSPALQTMIQASLLTIGPSIVYFVYRVAKGLSRALKGYRMNDVNAWF